MPTNLAIKLREQANLLTKAADMLDELCKALIEASQRSNQIVCAYCGYVEQFEENTPHASRVAALRSHIDSCDYRPRCGVC